MALSLCTGCARREAPVPPLDALDATSSDSPRGPAVAPIKVTLGLNWFPEVEHGGYYAALVHGYYREEGLDVKILPGGPDVPIAAQVAQGVLTFGIANADNVLLARAQQAPIVALMAPFQTSPRCLIVHESSGIKRFSDLKHMKIAMTAGASFTYYLQKKLPLEGVTIVPYSGSVALFLTDKNYAQQGYVFSEPFIARQQGGDPHVLMLADLGINPYTSLLVTRSDLLVKQPRLAEKMVHASLRGWRKYIESPRATNDFIHRLNPEMSAEILAYGADAIQPLVRGPSPAKPANAKLPSAPPRGLGMMTLDRWQTLADQLVETGQLAPGAVDPAQAFDIRFVKSSEGKNQRSTSEN